MTSDYSKDSSWKRRSRSRSREKRRHYRERSRSRSLSRSRSPSRSRRDTRDYYRDDRNYDNGRDWDDDRWRPRSRSSSRSRSRSRSRDRNRYNGGAHFSSGGQQLQGNGGLPHLDDGDYLDGCHFPHNGGSSRRPSGGYHSAYAANLAAGLDGSDSAGLSGRGRGASSSASSRRSASIHLKGLPASREEGDIYRLLQGFEGIRSVRVLRDKVTGVSKGMAFVDFESVEAAAEVMETEARYSLHMDGVRIIADYSMGGGQGGGAGTAAGIMDWICSMCSAQNFARRLECYQCSSARTQDVKWVAAEPEAPTAILKVGGLEPQLTEQELYATFAPYGNIVDVRLVRDKYTGAPRGFGFVEFHSIADASKALHALQGSSPPGHSSPLRISFARDRDQPPKAVPAGAGAKGSSVANDALEAAMAMQQYSAWEPKAFDESVLKEQQQQQQQQQQESQQQQEGQPSGSGQSGFVYDAASGYWYDAASGYYYDANTGLYYHQSTQQWYAFDQATGEYSVVSASGGQAGEANAAAATTAAAPAVSKPAVRAVAAAAPAAAPKKRVAAVIGSKPQLNQDALREAQLEKERLARLEAQAKAREERAKLQQQQQQQRAAAAAAAAAATASRPSSMHEQVVTAGPVQGVIRRGKWSQKNQG